MSDARRARRLCIPNQIASADEAAGATRDEDDAAAAEGGGRGGSSTVHASSAREVPHSILFLLGFVVVAGVVPPDEFVSCGRIKSQVNNQCGTHPRPSPAAVLATTATNQFSSNYRHRLNPASPLRRIPDRSTIYSLAI